MRKLHVEAEATTTATPETLWALLADVTTYSAWGPWTETGYDDPAQRGVGALRWLRYGRRVTVERQLELEENRRLVYSVERGLPVRNYRAEVTLTPAGATTLVQWEANWDATLLGRAVQRKLRTLYPEVVGQLVAAAEARDNSGRDSSQATSR